MRLPNFGIWGFAFGYFACYVPYSALTKAVSGGSATGGARVPGLELLPLSATVSMVGMFACITALRWWRHAGHRVIAGVRVPWPGRWTFLSGLCTAAIIGTTTLAYTFSGVSIVFMMLLMRGGLLVLAPLVDRLTGRDVRWFSWVALGLSGAALAVAFLGRAGYALTTLAVIDVAVYLASYFIRLRFMSRLAKGPDRSARTRYFVEEQMVATPAVILALVLVGLAWDGPVRDGFTSVFDRPIMLEVVAIGLFSQGTGIFGGLILLDPRENAFCVPVNRASSILAGVLAGWVLVPWGFAPPEPTQLLAAGLIVLAIGFLAAPSLAARRRPPDPVA